jgi:hypothetical protein
MLFITILLVLALAGIITALIARAKRVVQEAAQWKGLPMEALAIILEGPLGSSVTYTRVGRAMALHARRCRIIRDPELWVRNLRWGNLPQGTNGPNRKARRAMEVALQAKGKERARALSLSAERQREEERRRAEEALRLAQEQERLRLLRLEQERERIEAYCAANTNRLRAERRWQEKGTVKSSSIRRKSVVKSTDYYESNISGLTKAQIRNRNLIRWGFYNQTEARELASAEEYVNGVESRIRMALEAKNVSILRSRRVEARNWALLESRAIKAMASGDSSPETKAIYRAARAAQEKPLSSRRVA